LWPTPCASTYKGGGATGSKSHTDRFARFYLDAVVQAEEQSDTRINLNPEWVECLMGFPIGWTSIQASLFDGPLAEDRLSMHGNLAVWQPESHSSKNG
jgi:hypothetical protein